MPNTFIIAEIGQAHEGSLGILHSYIDSLAESGVDAIKFQTHIAYAESSQDETFRVKFSYEDQTRYDYWKRMEFTEEQWRGIKEHCDKVGVEFISSPFSIAAVELLERLGVATYKIGSGEVTNYLMLDRIARTGKRVILSSGMSSYAELSAAYARFKDSGCKVDVLQCTTKYPTTFADVGLNVLGELKERFSGADVGLSDHSGSIYPSLAAVSAGAKILETHVVFDRRMFGPDATSSLLIDEFLELVKGVRAFETMLSTKIEKGSEDFSSLKTLFGKTLAISKDVKAGDIVKFEHLESKKPGNKGIPAKDYESVLGMRFTRDIKAWSFLSDEDIQ